MQYAAKETCTKMANPTQGSWKRVTKAARYLQGVEKVTWAMRASKQDELKIDVHVEVDEWRYDDDQRHSGETLVGNTSDPCAERGGSWNMTWSSQEQTLGMQSMMTDLVMSGQVRVWTDSNAAQATRRGFGKTRHVELKCLWLQDVAKSGRVKMRRVPGEETLADHLTK